MSAMCAAVRIALGAVGPDALSGPMAAHVEQCDHCRHESVEYAEIEIALASLERSTHQAPAHLQVMVMDSLGPVAVPDIDQRTSFAVPVAAAALVATAAAGTAVLLKMRRQSAA